MENNMENVAENNQAAANVDIKTYISGLQADREKLKEAIIKYAKMVKTLEEQNAALQGQVNELQGKVTEAEANADRLAEENARLASRTGSDADKDDIAEVLIEAQKTARKVVFNAECKANETIEAARGNLNNIYFTSLQLKGAVDAAREHIEGLMDEMDREVDGIKSVFLNGSGKYINPPDEE